MKAKIPIITLCALILQTSGIKAQNELLPFSLQTVDKGNRLFELSVPTSFFSHEPQKETLAALGASTQTAFIKENGQYGLSGLIGKSKNYFSAGYSYQGYSVLHTQKAHFGYARNLFPGFGIGLSMAYENGNAIENRKAGHALDIGLSAVFKRGIWAVAFQAEQNLSLSVPKEKIWNRALFLRIGAGCEIYRNLHFGIDLYKDLRYPLQGGLAFAYQIEAREKPLFLVYAQARINPYSYQIGFAYTGKRMQAGISLSYQPPLGLCSTVGITFRHLFTPKTR